MCSILVIAAVAVCAGARSFAAIGEWAADAPQRVLAVLGARCDPRRGVYRAPGEATLRRALQAVDPTRSTRRSAHGWPTDSPAPQARTVRVRVCRVWRSQWTARHCGGPAAAMAPAGCTCSPR